MLNVSLLVLLYLPAPENVRVIESLKPGIAAFLIVEAALIFGMTLPNTKKIAQLAFLALICIEAVTVSHKTVPIAVSV